jgi:hypothetical protein
VIPSGRGRARRLVSAAALAAGAAAVVTPGGGCTQQTEQVAVRSLERSGRAAFVCLAAPGTRPTAALPLERCAGTSADTADDFGVDQAGTTTVPHLYALVTQTTRGEVALVDTTAASGNIVDEEPGVPGANFLPIGAQPTDIAATPGGTATFVGVAEIGREAIFALPSAAIRPSERTSEPALSSWPACRLPAAPGELLVVVDPSKDGATRATCDGAYTVDPPPLANPSHGDLSREGPGREKLFVTLPDLGGFAVIDAQTVLDREAGTFDACPIERWVPLQVELPPPGPKGPTPAPSAGCVQPPVDPPAVIAAPRPRPAGIALAGNRLFVADLAAPVVHVVDIPTPCEPVERPPLLPTDARDPSRLVVTSRVATTPAPTAGLKRYVYALDVEDGSTMAFDVSDDSASRYPLQRPHPEWNPFQPPDRVKYTAPPQDLLVITRDVPVTNPATGAASAGLRCNPDPSLPVCGTTSDPPSGCDPRTLYRAAGCDGAAELNACTYASGAGPTTLRGTFGFVLLSSGQIGVVDIDDLDAACRAPQTLTASAGCGDATGSGLATTREVSCNIVEPNAPRSAEYAVASDQVGHRAPGVASLPLLYDKTGALVASDATADSRGSLPFMVAPLSATGTTPPELAVGSNLERLAGDDGAGVESRSSAGTTTKETQRRYALAMNVEDPRVHISDQNWVVAWEGGVADYSSRLTNLRLAPGGAPEDGLYDPNGRYCDAGIQSAAAVRDLLIAQGKTTAEADAMAPAAADYVQITSAIPPENDMYWSAIGGACSYAACSGLFGTPDVPRPERDLRIREAYQDRLLLELRVPAEGLSTDKVKCCFPSNVTFFVRGGSQWIVQGDQAGFIHHVIPDPTTGACRNSCDPRVARKNGRAWLAAAAPVRDGDPAAFINPMFRFAIVGGSPRACTSSADCGGGQCNGGQCVVPPSRDMNFRFTTQGAFQSLAVDLASSTKDVQPQSIRLVPATGEIAVTDGSLNGLYLVSPQSIQISRQFY